MTKDFDSTQQLKDEFCQTDFLLLPATQSQKSYVNSLTTLGKKSNHKIQEPIHKREYIQKHLIQKKHTFSSHKIDSFQSIQSDSSSVQINKNHKFSFCPEIVINEHSELSEKQSISVTDKQGFMFESGNIFQQGPNEGNIMK